MKKKVKLLMLSICLILTFFCVKINKVNPEGIVGYTGNVEDTDYGASSGSAQSASATVELKYSFGEIVAIGVMEESGAFPGGDDSIFKGAIPFLSYFLPPIFRVDDPQEIAADIIENQDVWSSGDFTIHGLIFSSLRQAFIGLSMESSSGKGNYLELTNQATSDKILVEILAIVGHDGPSEINFSPPNSSVLVPKDSFYEEDYVWGGNSYAGMSPFYILGDISESTVTAEDEAGVYTGSLTITVTNL